MKSSLSSSQELPRAAIKKPPSVEKIKIEAPRDPEPVRPETQSSSRIEYQTGRSRGHKRTHSISCTNKPESESVDQKPVPQPAQKPKANPKPLSKPVPKEQDPTSNYQAALADSSKALFSDADTERLKNKVKAAEAQAKNRKARDNSLKTSLSRKRQAHEAAKREKEQIREKILHNAEIESEKNKKKKLVVGCCSRSSNSRRRRPDIRDS